MIPTERCNWLVAMYLTNMSLDKAQEFKDALHICPTWKIANKIYCKYLARDLNKPIAIFRAEMGRRKSKIAVLTVHTC